MAEGPSSLAVAARKLGAQHGTGNVSADQEHDARVPSSSISTIRLTPTSLIAFTSATRVLDAQFLKMLKDTPFDKVSAMREVQAYLMLKTSMAEYHLSKEVEEKKLAVTRELNQAESSYNAILNEKKMLEDKQITGINRRIEELEAIPTLGPMDVQEFEDFKKKVEDLRSSIDPDNWMDTN
ncbi:Pesticidal crystal protein Cry1Ad [Bienertia sinuspersici]